MLSEALSKEEAITPQDLEGDCDVYVQIPEDLLRHYRNFFTLMISQFITFFERRNEETAKPILFLLDEFPRLGKITPITEALATLRSKKITICLMIQSLKQLEDIYGQTTSTVLADLCDFKFVLRAAEPNTQDYFSKLVGTYDEIKVTQNVSRNALWGYTTGNSTSTTHLNKRILKPEEFAILTNPILLHALPNNAAKTFFAVQKNPYYSTK